MKLNIYENFELKTTSSSFKASLLQIMHTNMFSSDTNSSITQSRDGNGNNNNNSKGTSLRTISSYPHSNSISAPSQLCLTKDDYLSQAIMKKKIIESIMGLPPPSSAQVADSSGYEQANGDKTPFTCSTNYEIDTDDMLSSFNPSSSPILPLSPPSQPNYKKPEEPGSLQSIFAPPHPVHCTLNQTSSVLLHSKPSGHKKKPSNDEQKIKDEIDTNLSNLIPILAPGSNGDDHKNIPADSVEEIQIDIIAFNPFNSIEVRGAFLRKVLATVGLQLLVGTAWTLACLNVEPIGTFVSKYFWIICIAIGIYCILYFAVGCMKFGRTYPSNLIILILYTFTLSYICGYVTLQYSTWTIIMSLSATTLICMILSVVTLCTKLDITSWGIYLTTGCCLMMLYAFSVFTCSFLLTDSKTMSILNVTGAFFGSALVSLYLLYDLQMMIGGRLRWIDSEEWLFASMALFYDLVMIFVYLVQVIGFGGNNRTPHERNGNNANPGTTPVQNQGDIPPSAQQPLQEV